MLSAGSRRGYHVGNDIAMCNLGPLWRNSSAAQACTRTFTYEQEERLVEVKLKLIGSTSPDIFEQRLNDFLASLDKDDIVVDVKFSTSPLGNGVEYNALVQYQATDSWDD